MAAVVQSDQADTTQDLQVTTLSQEQIQLVAAADKLRKDDLRSRVSSLAQAISSFDGSAAPDDGMAVLRLDNSDPSGLTKSNAALAVGSMADVLKQFDANGNRVGSPSVAVAALTKPVNAPGKVDPMNNGFLAGGGGRV